MTGLTEADITRLIAGLILSRKAGATPERKTQDAEQETRIIPALYDETDTRMLLEVAKSEIVTLCTAFGDYYGNISHIVKVI